MAKANDKARPPITERFVTVQEIWGFPKKHERQAQDVLSVHEDWRNVARQ